MVDVGSVIRAKRPASSVGAPNNDLKCSAGRAVVATLQDDGRSVCVMWEPMAPIPIAPCTRQDFLVAPKSVGEGEEEDENETLLPMEEIQPLLEFEIKSASISKSIEDSSQPTIPTWKDRGDVLLRLGDASCAASYYERALYQSSNVSTGSTIIISIHGYPKIAEVDCIDETEDGSITSLDVTIVETLEEKTVKSTSVLIGILDPDEEKFQERILLNLARCMLQLADLDSVAGNRSNYLKSAVLATTLVITIASFREHGEEDNAEGKTLSQNAQTALILRVKAHSGMSKWPNAMADAKHLLKAGNEQGAKLVASLERQKKMAARTDKKLAKEMCKLVESSTTFGSVSARTSLGGTPISSQTQDSSPPKTHPATSPTLSLSSIAGLALLVFPVAAAILRSQLTTHFFKSDESSESQSSLSERSFPT
jgi:hypothetical protein